MYYLGIDAGTSGLKTLLVDEQGAVVGQAAATYQLHTPRPGWAEADPEEWWEALCLATRRVLATAEISGAEIAGVGFSGQMHTLVLLDEHLEPVRPAISWADTRGEEQRGEIERGVGRDRLIAITGSPAVSAFTATKLLWVQQHEPDVWARVHFAMLPKDYLRLQLTGGVATDPTDAGATGLLDLHSLQWSPIMVDLLGLSPGTLPVILPSGDAAGVVTPEAADATGLRAGTPVATGAGDQEAAALGCGVAEPGPVLITTGTGGQIFAATDRPVIDSGGRIHTLPHAIPQRWHVLAAIPAAGLAISWLRELLPQSAEADNDTSSSPPLFVPDLAGERTPAMDEKSRGAFWGLTLAHRENDLLYAAREGVAFALRTAFDVLVELGLPTDPILVTGGLSADQSFLQLLSDVLNRPLVRAAHSEASGYGAALLGARAAGSPVVLDQPCLGDERVEPARHRAVWHAQRYDLYRQARLWSREMDHQLASLEKAG